MFKNAQFVMGFIAGVCDDLGYLKVRDSVYSAASKLGDTGAAVDGFDCGVEFFRRAA